MDTVALRRKEVGAILFAPAPPPHDISEAAWQRFIEELAFWCGWRTYHTQDSRKSNPGWPDLVLVRPPHVIFAELKTRKGRVRPEQVWWGADLMACVSAQVQYHLWRPQDYPTVLAALLPPGVTLK